MAEEFQIVYVEKPEDAVWGIIGGGLDSFNKQYAGDYHFQRVCVGLQAPDGQFEGGVLGELFWDWFHLDLMWVREGLRGKGFGQRLLARIEDEARQRGAKHIFLDTFSFQAPEFYQKMGYRAFGELADFPAGHRRVFMVKEL